MINSIHGLLLSSNPIPLMVWATFYFFAIYLMSAVTVTLLSLLIKRKIESRTPSKTQLVRELLQSSRSIFLFGVGIIFPWSLIQVGWVDISTSTNLMRIGLEVLALIVWNDIHLYAVHRFLHSKLKRWHAAHHQSVSATPFTSYSMSASEALMLGSVMPIAMLAHDFSIAALFLLPIWSIIINAFAHSNCDFFPKAKENSLLSFIRHHQSHHSNYHGNYSFFFIQIDRWLRTDQPSLSLTSTGKRRV